MTDNKNYSHWECTKCGEINEISFDACWKCEHLRGNDSKFIISTEIDTSKVDDFKILKKEIPKSPVFLNLIAIFSIVGYLKNMLFAIFSNDITLMLITIPAFTLLTIGILGIIWLRRFGIISYLIGYSISLLFFLYPNSIFFLFFLIVPTAIIIWSILNWKKMG